MAERERLRHEQRPRRRGPSALDNAVLGGVGGVGLTYFVFVPHGFMHPLHWLIAGVGGVIGAVGAWLYTERDRLSTRFGRLLGKRGERP